ncbi:helix-turn-helix transcriptional regulator [Halopiger thermotolerans]
MGYDWGKQLFSSPHRLEVLRELRSAPADTQTLTDALSISRVTVQRHLNRCCELGWIRKVEGRYELTPLGERVCEATTTYLDRLAVLESHADVIDGLAAIDDGFDPLLLTDATVSVAESNNPHEPISHYRRAISGATTDEIRGILPVFSELLVEVHRDLLEAGVETELVTPRSVLEAAPPPDGPMDGAEFTLYVLDRPLEFGVTLTDERAFVGLYDEGAFVACIESDEEAFREWVADVYETHREAATRLSLEANGGRADGDLDAGSDDGANDDAADADDP